MTARAEFSFDSPLVVASGEFVFRGQRFDRGAVLPWRELGIPELDVFTMWQQFVLDARPDTLPHSGAETPDASVDVSLEDLTAEPAAELSDAELEVLTAPAGSGPTLAECREKFASVPQTAFGAGPVTSAPTTSKRRRR